MQRWIFPIRNAAALMTPRITSSFLRVLSDSAAMAGHSTAIASAQQMVIARKEAKTTLVSWMPGSRSEPTRARLPPRERAASANIGHVVRRGAARAALV